MNETTYTNSDAIQPMPLDEAIKLLKESLEERRNTEERMPQLLANLAGSVGWKVCGSKFLPKGTVFVGMGEPKDLFPEPKTSEFSPTKP